MTRWFKFFAHVCLREKLLSGIFHLIASWVVIALKKRGQLPTNYNDYYSQVALRCLYGLERIYHHHLVSVAMWMLTAALSIISCWRWEVRLCHNLRDVSNYPLVKMHWWLKTLTVTITNILSVSMMSLYTSNDIKYFCAIQIFFFVF